MLFSRPLYILRFSFQYIYSKKLLYTLIAQAYIFILLLLLLFCYIYFYEFIHYFFSFFMLIYYYKTSSLPLLTSSFPFIPQLLQINKIASSASVVVAAAAASFFIIYISRNPFSTAYKYICNNICLFI